MSRDNFEKMERKRFQKKLNLAISWLKYLEFKASCDDLQLDEDNIKEIQKSIKFLQSMN